MTEEGILNVVKNTVGYEESRSRTEFIKGAQVGISKSKELYENTIKDLHYSLNGKDEEIMALRSILKRGAILLRKISEYEAD